MFSLLIMIELSCIHCRSYNCSQIRLRWASVLLKSLLLLNLLLIHNRGSLSYWFRVRSLANLSKKIVEWVKELKKCQSASLLSKRRVIYINRL